MNQVRLRVLDMTCAGCATSVKNAMAGEPGVTDVKIDVISKLVTVDYDAEQTTPEALQARVGDAGFDAVIV